jgi:hypothetical protein
MAAAANVRLPLNEARRAAAFLRLPLAAFLRPGVAADARPNPEILTDKPPPPSRSQPGRTSATKAVEEADEALLDACGITDLDALAVRCIAARRALGKPTARWTARCLSVVIKLSVVNRGWPAASMEQTLLAVAGDRDTHSPARFAQAGRPPSCQTPSSRTKAPLLPWFMCMS